MAVYPRLIISDNNSDEVTKIETDLVPLSSGGIRIIIEGVFLIVLTTIWTVSELNLTIFSSWGLPKDD